MKTQNKQESEQQNVFGTASPPFPLQSCRGRVCPALSFPKSCCLPLARGPGMPGPYNGCFRQTTMPPWPPTCRGA